METSVSRSLKNLLEANAIAQEKTLGSLPMIAEARLYIICITKIDGVL